MNKKVKQYTIVTVGFIIAISLLTVGFAVSTDWKFDVSGRVKTRACLEFDNELDYGNVTSPSTTMITKTVTNIGEVSTLELDYKIYPTEGIEGISIEWDYDGSPILSEETITIGFTLIVTDDALEGNFLFTLEIFEVAEE